MIDNPDHTKPDSLLLSGIRNKDIASLEKLYDKYAAELFGAAVKVLKNEKEAETVLVDCFTEVWETAPGNLPENKPVFHWLAGICQHFTHAREEARSGKISSNQPNFFNLADLVEFAVEPRHKVKEKLLHKVEVAEKKKAQTGTGTRPVYVAPEIHFNHKKRDKYMWLLAACFTLLVISNIVSFYIYQRWKRTQSQLADAETEQIRLTENVNKAQLKIAQLQTSVVVLEDDQMRRVQLSGQPKSPESLAMVHYNPKTRQVFLELKQLSLPPDGYQYQLWALDKSGKPINAGLVDLATSLEGMQQMQPIKNGRTFMLTLEPEGGSSEPNLNQIFVMGKF